MFTLFKGFKMNEDTLSKICLYAGPKIKQTALFCTGPSEPQRGAPIVDFF